MHEPEQEAKHLRLHFLWSAAHIYARECPTLSRHLMSRFTTVVGKGVSDGVRQRYCPTCGSLFAPPTSTTKIFSRRRLREHQRCAAHKGGAISWQHKPLPSARRYVVVSCLVCQKSFVSAAVENKGRDTAPHSRGMATPQMIVPHSTKAKRSHRRSSTLKGLVQESAQLKQQRLQLLSASPSLADFLSG